MRLCKKWMLFGQVACACVGAFAAKGGEDAEALWREILALDAGPARTARGAEDARTLYGAHVLSQEKALRRFLQAPGNEPHRFEARLRLARALTMRAEMEGDATLQEESAALLDELEQTGTPLEKSHVAFTRITQWMRRNRFPDREQRLELLAAAREFRERFPDDKRVPRLLAEVATRFDRDPETKEALLRDALRLTADPELKRRVKDDLVRVALLGKPLRLSFKDMAGKAFNLDQNRGRPAVILYFSENSPPSLAAWISLQNTLGKYPEVLRVAISLDETRMAMEKARASTNAVDWTIAWDGLGWMSPFARRWGVNAVPTAWIVDRQGRLTSLDALDGLAAQLDALGETPVR